MSIDSWMDKEIMVHIQNGIFRSDQIIHSVVSDSLRPHESQHARPPCPSPTPGVHSDSCPSSQWCHPAISSSVVPFFSCPQSLPASESFPMSQLILSHKKEHIWVSSNEVDETGAYYTEWSKPERKTPIQYTNAYIWTEEAWQATVHGVAKSWTQLSY